jgi:4-hydroxybenzoate polyprenyltransferase
MPQPDENLPADSPADSLGETFLMRALPKAALPFAKLARLERPIGTWLLFWPCFWGLALAASEHNAYPPLHMLILFGVGALVMRGAGCTLNDIVDRDIDAKVARTAARPLPSGQVSLRQAGWFLGAQLAVGFVILIQLNWLTVGLGVASLVLVASYPFMKRFTYWPQFFLGLTFNWGALMGYAAINGYVSQAALMLYAAGVVWTLGYDTIYAHQDREDDALIGVKSSALKLGHRTKPALFVFYGASLACLAGVGVLGGMTVLYWPALGVVAYHLTWQIYQLNIDDPKNCLRLFRLNRDTGLIIGASILLGVF